MGVCFNGSAYQGWQSQSSGQTVQDQLEKALAQFTTHKVSTLCAGRTDAGVHGLMQVIHFDTDLARDMVTRDAMSEHLGLATFEQAPGVLIYPAPMLEKRAYSERTARAIDAEISTLLSDAHQRVTDTLSAKRALLTALAQALQQKETIDRETLDILLKQWETG